MAKVLGRAASVGAARRVLQPLHQDAHQVEHHARMARDQRVERVGRNAQQFGVAHRDDLRGVFGTAGDQRHLADRLAGRNVRHQAALAALVFGEHAEAAGDHQKERALVLAVALEQHAAGQAEPVGLRQQLLERRVAHIFQQRKAAQVLAQRLRDRRCPARS